MIETQISQKKKILCISSKFPWPESGACEQDRAQGIRDLLRLGFDVRVIAHTFSLQEAQVPIVSRELGIQIFSIPYAKHIPFFSGGWKEWTQRVLNPRYIDGAAYEYTKPLIRELVEKQLDEWKPDAVICDFSFSWPLYPLIKKRGIPVITKVQTYEAGNFLDENDASISKWFKFIPKWFNERRMVKWTDWIWAITPNERDLYLKLGAKHVSLLPLRKLPFIMTSYRHEPTTHEKINVVFLASTYSVRHNRSAMEMVVKEVAPMALKTYPGKFKFFILGKQFPDGMKSFLNESVVQPGYVPDLQEFLKDMDIALCPSLLGHGMQQKVFEPLVKGMPVVTNPRVLAGFPFKDGVEVMLARGPQDFVDALGRLVNGQFRKAVGDAARKKAEDVFDQSNYDRVVLETMSNLFGKNIR